MASNEQDLLPDQTEGFKVGEKKTMDEYNQLGMSSLYTFLLLICCMSSSLFIFTIPYSAKQHYGKISLMLAYQWTWRDCQRG